MQRCGEWSRLEVRFQVARCMKEKESKAARLLAKQHGGACLLRMDKCVWTEYFCPFYRVSSALMSCYSVAAHNVLMTKMRMLHYTIDGMRRMSVFSLSSLRRIFFLCRGFV